MSNKNKKTVMSCGGLESFLSSTQAPSWKKNHNGKTCYEAYIEVKRNLEPIQKTVIEGAMAEGIRSTVENYKTELGTINKEESEEIRIRKTHELFASDPVIFLNDHGPEHMEKVIDRANSIIFHFEKDPPSEFEAFLLLCAIQIHDIGNVLGRAGHERKLVDIFDNNCKSTIPDTPERRAIKNIAMAHGGKSELGKDTISLLSPQETIFSTQVRTRLLAAILRFADELADDATRANRAAMDLGILGTNSEIYHSYSRALHTVNVEGDSENHDCKVSLVYELETDELKKTYLVGGHEKYLLDEIYDRTLKMELERRYCMKFMYPCINIGRIDVTINVYGRMSEKERTISYTLEDVSYPDAPVAGQIVSTWKKDVPSGEELLQSLIERGVIDAE